MEQGGPCVRACDSVWQHERPWSGTLKSQSRLCGVARERHESLVHSCVGVGAFVELKMLFWPKTLNRKHGPLFFSSAAFVCVCVFFFPVHKREPTWCCRNHCFAPVCDPWARRGALSACVTLLKVWGETRQTREQRRSSLTLHSEMTSTSSALSFAAGSPEARYS